MDSTVLLSYRKTAVPTEAFLKQQTGTGIMEKHSATQSQPAKMINIGKKQDFTTLDSDKFESRQILSSSLSTNYASSSSAASTTSEEELTTVRRYSESNQSSNSSLACTPDNNSMEDCANSNAAFVMDKDDLCNNNVLIEEAAIKFDQIDLHEEESGPTSITELKPVVEAEKKKVLLHTTNSNCFVSLYINGKRCMVTINSESLVYEPELTPKLKQNGKCAYFFLLFEKFLCGHILLIILINYIFTSKFKILF